ncbi:hypothetical protein [Psychrobacter aestuarii]|uniref:Preprotein translocase subunit SecA n=1 Tax=Psychrobacter aestuarii TaxID=556327 RepID=A0ABP3FJE1_9GAMM|nr:hypothetical protein [Psychrobacter aestuarii]
MSQPPISNASTQTVTHVPSPPPKPPNRFKLGYDIFMLIVISIDLLLISLDAVLMSQFSANAAEWLNITQSLVWYQSTVHEPLRTAGGFFTIFLVAELFVRWMIAIQRRTYYRWFFFPFVHWYEVLGCFPQLRMLRLFRVVVIGRRLYQLGYQVLPQLWIERIKFYGDILLEELSDRVVLTIIANFRGELTDTNAQQSIINSTLTRNRAHIEAAVLSMLRQELIPQLQQLKGNPTTGNVIATEVGNAIEEGLANTPELRRYVRMIPIAGSLIESQMLQIGHNVGENVASAVTERLLDAERLDALMQNIAHGIANMDTQNSALETLIAALIADSLSGLEAQVKVQQWKHKDMLNL